MRIWFFSGNISRTGGTERVTTVLASALTGLGHSIGILSMREGVSSGFPVHHSVQLASLGLERSSANFSDLRRWSALRRFVVRNSVDVLVDVDVIQSWYSIPATWRLPTRVISWEHFHRRNNVGDFGQRVRREVARRLAVRFASRVVTLSERDRQQYLSADDCKIPIVVIPNPLTLQSPLPSPLTEHVVLAAGRLVPEKGFDRLIDAWSMAAPSLPSWKLRIVGSGPEERALRTRVARLRLTDSVEFVAQTGDMEAQYRSASVYAMTSRFEGLPLVLIEAKACGLPIISFDFACGPSDIVRDGVDGVLVADGDTARFADELCCLALDPARRQRQGALALTDRRFEMKRVVEEWSRIFASESAP